MPVSIQAAVGFQGLNRPEDVMVVQEALQHASGLTLDARVHPGPADGFSGDGTEGAIARFQRRLGHFRPDARIDPDGETLVRLNALLAIADVRMSFPLRRSSEWPYTGPGAGMRAFGARRSGGARAHAGIDLYAPDFSDVLALADGVVTRGPYDFYLKTLAVEIDHGPVLVCYGALAVGAPALVAPGDLITRGQPIGRVGVLTRSDGSRLGVPSMMLHLEMYDQTQTGKLTRAKRTSSRYLNGRPFYRRRDLIDPTGFIVRAPLWMGLPDS